jgi:hypothetical protein
LFEEMVKGKAKKALSGESYGSGVYWKDLEYLSHSGWDPSGR